MIGPNLQIANELAGRVFYLPEKQLAEPWLALELGGTSTVTATIILNLDSAALLHALADQITQAYALKAANEQ